MSPMNIIGQGVGSIDIDLINSVKARLKNLVGIYVASLDGLLVSYIGAGDPDKWAALTATLAALGSTYVKEMSNLMAGNHRHIYTLIQSDKGFIINFRLNDYAVTIIDDNPDELNTAVALITSSLTGKQ